MHLHGPHRTCLTHDSMVFVHVNSSGGWDTSRGDPIEIPISSIRVCGHKETLFFIVPGRGSGIGSGGKLWMDLGDEAMASQMHHTIVNVMYAAKQEEALNYRHRSYSSGSNSGRVRSTRSYHNNPPPKHIGMGKAPGTSSSSKRIRCDSLPGTHVAGLHHSRPRTGSEGEHTMKRPTHLNSFRSPYGSHSPGVQRFLKKRCHARHCVNHIHTSSFSSSCQSSSEASSTEQLNINHSWDSSPYSLLANGAAVGQASDLAARDSAERSITPDQNLPTSSAPPVHLEDLSVGYRYCPNCSIPLHSHPVCDAFFNPVEQAPPPPNEQAPSIPLGVSSHTPEYVNFPVHSRTHSLDDSLSHSTAASSLSTSPQQHSLFQLSADHQNFPASKPITCVSHSPSHPALSDQGSCSSSAGTAHEDYTLMDCESVNKYPHHISSSQRQPHSGSTIIAKLVSFTNSMTSSGVTSASTDQASSVYTPMTAATSSPHSGAESVPPAKSSSYVFMRSFTLPSAPQDIEKRRRSVPANLSRNGSALNGSLSVYGHSPDKYSAGSAPCSFCAGSDSVGTRPGDGNCCFRPSQSPHSSCQVKLPESCGGGDVADSCSGDPSVGGEQHVTTPPVNDEQRLSATRPLATSNYLDMRPINAGLHDVTDAVQKSKSASDHDADGKEVSNNGYLPMSRLPAGNAANVRRALSTAPNDYMCGQPKPVVPPQYPHQRRDSAHNKNLSTNSLDRSKRSHKSKRPTSLAFRQSIGGGVMARRTQSLRHHSKKAAAPEQTQTVLATVGPEPPSPVGGEYVNLDYTKAQMQSSSPHVISVTLCAEPRLVPSLLSRPTTSTLGLGSEYTQMACQSAGH